MILIINFPNIDIGDIISLIIILLFIFLIISAFSSLER